MLTSAGARHVLDGLFEAEKGRWRSAAESFERASRLCPEAWGPMLAAAICRLRLGEARGAVVWLETAPCRHTPAPAPWDAQYAWLCAAARLAVGDPDGAARAGAALPERLRARIDAHVLLADGQYARGVRALLFALRGPPVRGAEAGSTPGPRSGS